VAREPFLLAKRRNSTVCLGSFIHRITSPPYTADPESASKASKWRIEILTRLRWSDISGERIVELFLETLAELSRMQKLLRAKNRDAT
jgi:hypothetical protein